MPMTSPGQRAASYWFADGLPDIVLGVTVLVFGAAGLWWCLPDPKHGLAPDFFFLAAGQLLFILTEREILDYLKLRVTYPRTGYVRPPVDLSGLGAPSTLTPLSLKPWPKPGENMTHFRTRTVFVVFLWCFLLLTHTHLNRWYRPFVMPSLAVALYAFNWRSERPYRWWSALILALSGPALLWLDVPPLLQPLLLPLLAGAWLVAQGVFTLLHYLRANPYPRAPEGVRT